jgi:uncharacterized membrane protein YphA (DoxX/SURF4 family)
MSIDSAGRNVVGLNPWLPWPWSRWRWWTAPVRAERLAALRIGLGITLLLDVLLTYIPDLHLFYGGDSLSNVGGRDLFDYWFKMPKWNWSWLKGVVDPYPLRLAMIVWVVATVFMLVGFCTRFSTFVVWVLSVSFANINTFNDNAGDTIRTIVLLYLWLGRSGAVWSIDSLLARWLSRKGPWLARLWERPPGPVYIYPWVPRLLFIQMTFIYFINGLCKVVGPDWRYGNTLYYVLNDLTLARWSYAQLPVPLFATRLMTWSVLVWEVTFPFWMLLPWIVSGIYFHLPRRKRCGFGFKVIRFLRRVRGVMLCFGVLFHLGILVLLELGFFAPYMMCLYLPLVPWERWLARRRLTCI